MVCGNIGESVLEEVELVEKGRNYGWPDREGSFTFTSTDHEGEVYLLSKQNGTLYKVKKDDSSADDAPQGGGQDWAEVRDFESGNSEGFDTMPSASGSFSIVNDPREGPVNRVLRLQAHGSESALTARLPIPEIPDDSHGTAFVRFFIPGQDHNINFGLSAEADASGYGDFETQLRSAYFEEGKLQVRDEGDFVDAADIQAGTWYSAWYQIHNAEGTAADSWNLYLKGGEFSNATLIKTGIGFRNGTSESLKSFLWIVSAITVDDEGREEIYFDDLFVDVGHANLTDPTPEGWQLVDQFERLSPLDDWEFPAEEDQLVNLVTEPSGNHYLRHAASPDGSSNDHAIAAKKLPFVTQVSQTMTTSFRLRIEGDSLDHSVGVSALNPSDAADFSRERARVADFRGRCALRLRWVRRSGGLRGDQRSHRFGHRHLGSHLARGRQ
jgi:hypothetical protein